MDPSFPVQFKKGWADCSLDLISSQSMNDDEVEGQTY